MEDFLVALPGVAVSGEEEASSWFELVTRLAKRRNVHCALSPGFLVGESEWSEARVAHLVKYCLRQFGPDRCVFGIGWPGVVDLGREQAGFSASDRFQNRQCHRVLSTPCHRVLSHVGFAEWSKCHTCSHVRSAESCRICGVSCRLCTVHVLTVCLTKTAGQQSESGSILVGQAVC